MTLERGLGINSKSLMSNTKSSTLFFIAILCAFVVGTVVGVLIPIQLDREEHVITVEKVADFLEEEIEEVEVQDEPEKEETEEVKRYKKMLQANLEESSKPEVVLYYGVLIEKYIQSDRANTLAIRLKDRYDWNVAVYPIKNLYHIIVGPFYSKKEAHVFLDKIPNKARFLKSKVILFPQNN